MFSCVFVSIPQKDLLITLKNITFQFYVYYHKNYYAT